MTISYDIGQAVRLWGTFEAGGIPTDPGTITLKVQDPSGNEDTFTFASGQITRLSAGVYYKDIVVDESGTWYYNYTSTGAVAAAQEKSFSVDTSEF